MIKINIPLKALGITKTYQDLTSEEMSDLVHILSKEVQERLQLPDNEMAALAKYNLIKVKARANKLLVEILK